MKGFLQKIFKPTKKEAVIVVSGLPRSGTSMMMKMLEAGGVEVMIDGLRTADSDNPKGYYEFERVKQLDKGDKAWVPDSRGKVVKVISALLKHLPEDEEYKVIFMRRNMPEILASQRKMLVNREEDANKMDDAKMTMLFEKHLEANKAWLQAQPNFSTIYVHYSDILSDPMTQATKVNDFLGGILDSNDMAAIVDPNLYRNRQK